MRSGLLLAVVAIVHAQTASDSVAQAAKAAFLATGWRGEGTLDTQDQKGIKFRIAFEPPRHARLEIANADEPLWRVCDGDGQYTYYPDLKGFVRVLLPQIGPCAFPMNAWPPLAQTLQSPVFAGTDTIAVDGHPRTCQIVRGAFTWQGRDPAVHETVTLCIDREENRILRYQLQHASPPPATSLTYTFSSLAMNPQFPAGSFDFQAPEGSRLFASIDWLTPIPTVSPGVLQVSNAVSAPILMHLVPPVVPPEASLVEGGNTVALRVEIGRDGIAHAIQVSRTLAPGLDEAAIACVKKWRFEPAMSSSGQVPVAATILVHFIDPK